jgi:hypothetical protein
MHKDLLKRPLLCCLLVFLLDGSNSPPLTPSFAHHINRHRRADVMTFSMDEQIDTKSFLSSFATAGTERGLHCVSTSNATALPLGRGGPRGPVGVQPQPQAACVLNRVSSDLSGGGGDRSCPGEGLESTSTLRPCTAPRVCRNFWSAGDYDAAPGRSTRQPSKSAMQEPFLSSILFVLDTVPPNLFNCRCSKSYVCPPQISPLQCYFA